MHASKIIFGKIIFGVPAAAENLQSPPLHTPSRGINLRLHPVHLHPRHLVTIGSSALTAHRSVSGLGPKPTTKLCLTPVFSCSSLLPLSNTTASASAYPRRFLAPATTLAPSPVLVLGRLLPALGP